jgi:hypothetical protein
MNEACSAPVHVAITETDPLLAVEPVPHATAVTTAISASSRARFIDNSRILKTPIDVERTA